MSSIDCFLEISCKCYHMLPIYPNFRWPVRQSRRFHGVPCLKWHRGGSGFVADGSFRRYSGPWSPTGPGARQSSQDPGPRLLGARPRATLLHVFQSQRSRRPGISYSQSSESLEICGQSALVPELSRHYLWPGETWRQVEVRPCRSPILKFHCAYLTV